MNVLGVIPARGGSKGIPAKNLVKLGGITLLERACASASKSNLTSFVVSTDDPAIAKEAERLGFPVHKLRPAEFATDTTPMLDVLVYELSQLRLRGEPIPDAVMVLQPTSPFRTSKHINDAITLLEKSGADSVVSVTEVPHRFTPEGLMELQGESLVFLSENPSLRRQDKARLFARNGPVIALTRTAVIEAGKLYGAKIAPLVMNERESIDIDTVRDLELAEAILALQK